MKVILLSTIIVSLVVYILNKWLLAPCYYRRQRYADFLRHIKGLMLHLAPGSYMHVQHELSGKSLQYGKKCSTEGNEILSLSILHKNVQNINKDCAKEISLFTGAQLKITDNESEAIDNLIEFTWAKPTKNDYDSSIQAARNVFECMGINDDETFTIHFRGSRSEKSLHESVERVKKKDNIPLLARVSMKITEISLNYKKKNGKTVKNQRGTKNQKQSDLL